MLENDEAWKALGEMKLSELDPIAADWLLDLMFERMEELDEEIRYHEDLLKPRPKDFTYTCHRRKYKRANVRNHADKKRPDSENIPSDS